MTFNATQNQPLDPQSIHLCEPSKDDGYAVHQLIAACPPLDANSVYCNLLQCHHFAATSILASHGGRPLGFISGYRLPQAPDCLFVWQVAVHPEGRGIGLAKRMLHELLARESCAGVHHLHTTINPGNGASWALFRSLARELGASLHEQLEYRRDSHFGGQHDDEIRVHIGPFSLHPQPFSKVTSAAGALP